MNTYILTYYHRNRVHEIEVRVRDYVIFREDLLYFRNGRADSIQALPVKYGESGCTLQLCIVPLQYVVAGGSRMSSPLSVFYILEGIVAAKGSYLTKGGFSKLEAELHELRTVRRTKVAERIQKAKELGGTVDNAEYDDSKNEQAFIEGRVLTLEKIVANVIIIGDIANQSDRVQLGGYVTLLRQNGDEEGYTIVGSAEADPAQGRISNESPVGKALLNKRVGEDVQVKTPAGIVTLTISGIS